MKQVVGLAEALRAAHYLVDDDGRHHGASYRHGDLKPHNILWFPDGDGFGTLKIGDWSEAKEHNVDTQMRYATTAVYGTRRYEPPEVVTGTHADVRSRLYDMWSIGCIFFELLVWLLYGLDELKTFSRFENQESAYSSPFFEVDMAGGKKTARVHRIVKHWMERMAQDPACQIGNTALGDLLETIQTGLLVVKLPKAGGSFVPNKPGGERGSEALGVQNIPSITLTSTDEMAPKAESSLQLPGPARLRAIELCDRLSHIINTDEDESYWFTDRSLRLTAAIPRPGQTRTVTKLPGQSESLAYEDNDYVHTSADYTAPRIDYAHPRRTTVDWKFEVDNTFATNILSSPGRDTEWTVPIALITTHLCGKCVEFQNRIYLPRFSITYTTQEINDNTKAGDCGLCPLLQKTLARYDSTMLPTITFEKVGSTLSMNGIGPVLSLFRNNDAKSMSDAPDIQIGFANLPGPDSALRLDILRNWLRECDSRHVNPMCKRNDDKSPKSIGAASAGFPRLLLDLDYPGNSVIRLINTTGSALGPIEWIALDFVWGRGPYYSTTLANLDKHLTGIELDLLPATFADAVLVTRALGVRYLWIDSICMVQDDIGVLQEDLKRVEDVYSNAWCVLAASSATSPSAGLLRSRSERDSVAVRSPPDDYNVFYICEFIDDFQDHVLQGALGRRAWSLQSHALARRTICFTDYQVYWECGHGVRCETMTKMKSNSAALLGDSNFPQILKIYPPGEQLQRVQELYRHYSRLQLTHSADRPVAIAGLERRLLRTMNVRGGFGILDGAGSISALCRTLLWQRGGDAYSFGRIGFPLGRTRPPSWSWMAYTGAIDYLHIGYDKCDWQDIEPPWSRSTVVDSDNILIAKAWEYIGWQFTANPGESIIFDVPFADSEKDNAACVVLGIEKGSSKDLHLRRQYVILVKLRRDRASDGSPLWERIGVGYVYGTKLGREIGIAHIA
ncbi:hypothetical protein GQ44DRAFT_693949 [Phaeosphaeriaceae sp. PMI808]|nr:hypothetical protein GQ44DRAFT_693949 [Phaeosphaeriaceae sp. PMI808]